jgi:hypothetical protein
MTSEHRVGATGDGTSALLWEAISVFCRIVMLGLSLVEAGELSGRGQRCELLEIGDEMPSM